MTHPLPSGWQEVKLGDIANITMGQSPKSEFYNKEKNGLPFLQGSSTFGYTYPTFNIYSSDIKKIAKNGSILMSVRAPVGDINIANTDICIGRGLCSINANNKSINNYIFYILKYYKNNLLNNQKGTTFGAITKDDIINLDVIIPPLEEQKRIAEVLSLCDEVIENLTELIDKKEQYKKGVMQRVLSGEVRFKGFTDEWKTVKLKDILIAGSKDRVNDTSKYKKITIKLHNKGIEFANIERKMADKRPFYIRKKDEIIIGKQNYFNGSIAIVNEEFDNTICSNAIMSFKVNNSCNNKFIYSLLSRESYMKKYYHLANGTGQKELSENDFFNFTLSVPSLEEQKKIAGLLSAIDEDIENLKKQLELRKQQKKGLMQKLLTGEVRV
ncbi:restriction endonuclease subunit S [Brachyspira intermedia]|uniref:restriction endonuclease subunit S n=1 Tax=Brachyspira intermedia TaxID=84377 RepID=UPI00260EF75C|nr:restriction endonuclease subunit S [uncultured Brachyspira sp.]